MSSQTIGKPRAVKSGLRQQNKLEKRQRIRSAARELFSEHGYDNATMRQIARRARVGLGTLFQYAQDKRDLIFLIFNEELSTVTDEALRAPQPEHSFLDQLLAVFATHYYFFSKDPVLSRILLRELVFYSEGIQAEEFLGIRARLLNGLSEIVRSVREARGIARRDATPTPHPYTALTELRQLLVLLIDGLSAGSQGG